MSRWTSIGGKSRSRWSHGHLFPLRDPLAPAEERLERSDVVYQTRVDRVPLLSICNSGRREEYGGLTLSRIEASFYCDANLTEAATHSHERAKPDANMGRRKATSRFGDRGTTASAYGSRWLSKFEVKVKSGPKLAIPQFRGGPITGYAQRVNKVLIKAYLHY